MVRCKQSKAILSKVGSGTGRQIPPGVTCMWNLDYNTNEHIYKQKETHRHREQACRCQGGAGVGKGRPEVWD